MPVQSPCHLGPLPRPWMYLAQSLTDQRVTDPATPVMHGAHSATTVTICAWMAESVLRTVQSLAMRCWSFMARLAASKM